MWFAGCVDDGHGDGGGGLHLDGLLDVHIAVGPGYSHCLGAGGGLHIACDVPAAQLAGHHPVAQIDIEGLVAVGGV